MTPDRGVSSPLSTESAEGRRRAQEFLVAATRGLDASLDFERTARTIVEKAVPELAELCVLDFVRRDGWVGDSIVGAASSPAAARLEEIRRQAPLDPHGEHPVAQVLRAGRPMVWRDLTSPDVMKTVVQSDEHRQLIEDTRYQSAAVAPLIARGSTLGAISFLHASTDLRATRPRTWSCWASWPTAPRSPSTTPASTRSGRARRRTCSAACARPNRPTSPASTSRSSSTPSARAWRSAATSTTSSPPTTAAGC